MASRTTFGASVRPDQTICRQFIKDAQSDRFSLKLQLVDNKRRLFSVVGQTKSPRASLPLQRARARLPFGRLVFAARMISSDRRLLGREKNERAGPAEMKFTSLTRRKQLDAIGFLSDVALATRLRKLFYDLRED